MNETLWCPVCDAGWVEQVHIFPGGHDGLLCAECEAFWEEGEMVDAAHFTQFSYWLKKKGILPEELEITRSQATS